MRGVPVTVENTRPDIPTAFAIDRLDRALALIEEHRPERIRHLRRDVVGLWIASYPSRGVYFPDRRVILTELSFLGRAAEFSVAQVASSILHESVHARVHQMGVHLGFDQRRRDMAREERLCRRAEIAFGESLPPALGRPVVERAAAALGLSDDEVAPSVDWEEAVAAKRRSDAAAVRAWRETRG